MTDRIYRQTCLITLCAALLCGSVAPSFAGNSSRPTPLLLKIKAQKPHSGIRIHKGHFPKADLKISNLKIDPYPLKSINGKKFSSAPEIPEDIACAMSRTAPLTQNQIKNIADSLREYARLEKLDPSVIDTLQRIAAETNTDFELLVAKAMLESDLGRNMTSPVSTARGIFQYIENTWLTLIHRYGERIGYKNYQNSIEIDAETGQARVVKTSSISKADILDLRFDPYAAAKIKAYQIKDETGLIQEFKGESDLNAADHYIAHMLGLALAKEFYDLKNQESGEILAHSSNPLFREAVALNRPFFYDEDGRGLTASQAYTYFNGRIAKAYTKLHKIVAQYGKQDAISVNACSSTPQKEKNTPPELVSAKAEIVPDTTKFVQSDLPAQDITPAYAMPASPPAVVEKPKMLPAKGFVTGQISPSDQDSLPLTIAAAE